MLVGGVLSTVIFTESDTALLPATSQALAVKKKRPSFTVSVFQFTEYGSVVSSPILIAS